MELDTDGMPVVPRDIPEIPNEVYEAGWIRDEINYPSYKDYLRTSEPDQTYDFYIDYLIEGERHTYFFRRTNIADIIDNWQALSSDLTDKVVSMANESGEEIGIIPNVQIDFVWRAVNPIEIESEV